MNTLPTTEVIFLVFKFINLGLIKRVSLGNSVNYLELRVNSTLKTQTLPVKSILN